MNKHLRCIGACLCLLFSMTMQAEMQPYALINEKDSVCELYYGEAPENALIVTTSAWSEEDQNKTTKVVFNKSFNSYRPKSLLRFFSGHFPLVRNIEGLENLVTDSVVSMSNMFADCGNIESLDLRSFNTSSVKNVGAMFYACKSLKHIELGDFNTSAVTSMGSMFAKCTSLEELDLSSFDVRNVTSMGDMFNGDKNLKRILVGSKWLVNPEVNGRKMFRLCKKLVGGEGTAFDTLYIDHAYAHVDGGAENPGYLTFNGELKKVPYAVGIYSKNTHRMNKVLLGFDTLEIKYGYLPVSGNANSFELNCDGKTWWVNDVDSFFVYSRVIRIDPSMKEYPLKTTAYLFAYCSSVRYLSGLNNLNTDSVTDMTGMFYQCDALGKYLDFKGFNTRNVTKMDSMFANMGVCIPEDEMKDASNGERKKYRYTLDLRELDTRNVTSMEKMFYQLYWVDTLDISSFDTRKVTNMSNMFRDGPNNYIASGESFLKTIYVGDNWSTASLINTEAGIFGKELNGGNGGVSALFGGAGTYKDVLYDFYGYEVAHVDGGVENPGLFTSHNPKTYPEIYGVLEGRGNLYYFVIRYGVPPKNAYRFKCEQAPKAERVQAVYNYDTNSWVNESGEKLNAYGVDYVEIDSTVRNCSPKTLASFFAAFARANFIEGLENLRTDSVRSLKQMFCGCESLKTLELQSFKTRSVKDVGDMFFGCKELKTIYVGKNWIMSNLTKNTVRVFEDCPNIVGGAGTQWTSSKKTAEYAHVDGGPDNPGYLTEYKLVPYAVGKRSIRPHLDGDFDLGTLYGWDTLTIKYGIPEEGAFEIVCDGKNWWKNDKDTFWYYSTYINIDPSFSKYPIKTTANLFKGCWHLEEVNGLKYINTDSVTDMSGMFAECNYIVKLDLKGFKTPNVTKMDSMFFQVGLYNNGSTVNYESHGYTYGYGSYVDLNLSDFNTQNVTSMKSMFYDAKVDVLDICNFDTRKVTSMNDMLHGESFIDNDDKTTLNTIYVGENWSVEAVENKQERIFGLTTVGCAGSDETFRTVFSDCELARVDGGFENPGLFSSHKELNKFPELYALLFENGKVGIYYGNAPKNAYKPQVYLAASNRKRIICYWKKGSEKLNEKTVLTISVDSSVANCRTKILNGLFSFEALKSIEGLEYFVTDSVRDMGYMFTGSQLNTIDLRGFNTSSLKNTYYMFSGCSELKTIYVGDGWTGWTTDELSGNGMFASCSNLVGGAGTKWSESKTSAVYARIDGGEENPGYFTKAKIDTFIIDGLKYIITDRMHVSVGWESSTEDTIVIPQKVTYKDKEYIVNAIMDEGFSMRYLLKSVVIPESVTKIGERAFYDDYNIFSLEVPSSVTSIGASAFVSIRNVVYAGDAEGSPWGAIAHNGDVDYDLKFIFSDTTRTKLLKYFGNDSVVVIPNTVKELGRNSFAKIIELKSVDLNNVEKIDDKAFTYTGLQEISLSNKIKYIGERAFFNTYIKKILLPSSVDTMGSSAFSITDTVYCRWTTVPVGKQYHRGWNYKVNTVIYNCKLLNVSVANSDSSTVEVSGHVGIDAEGAYWYEDSASATIKAVPCKGYEFVQWSDNVKKNPRTFAMTSDTAIAAEFKAKNYIITYKVDGKVYQRDTVACGDAITDMPTPKKEGYTFVGWDNLQESMPAGNVSVNAIFVVNNYTITYKVNGKVYQVDTVAYGDTIVTPKDPKQDNMVFDGWSELPTTMPAKNLIVIGSFSKKAYVLTYKVDGEVYQRDTITSGANITPAREPKKEGYTFSGWKNLPDTMPSKNLTVTGSYDINSYIITYWANNEIFQVDTVAYGDTIVAAKAAEKEGYTFGGWKDLPETMPAKNLTIRCSFEINYYTLTFMAGGEIFQQDSLMYGEYIYHPETPLRDGYNFIDWDSIPYFMPAKDVIVTAEYEAITYYIYYLVNDAIYFVDSVSYGDSIVAIAYPEKEHYVFSGWSEMPATMPAGDLTIEGTLRGEPYVITYMVNDKVYYLDTVEYNSLVEPIEGPEIEGYSFFDWDDIPMYMPAKNVTVTAFLEVEYYTITYKVDGKVYQVDTLAYGDTIVAAKEPKESGLTFSGWSKLPVTMPAKDLIVTGTFSGESSYVITYKVDGKVYQRDTLIYGSTILAAEEPEKEGYTFSGWNNLPTTMPAKNVTVNGEFSVNSYHIYYLVDEELYKVDTVAYGDAIEVIANPKKEGYTFSGWSEIPATMPAEDLTVTGTFSGKSYVLTYKVDGKVYQRDTLTNGATIIAPEPEKEGYTFSGWNNLPATMPAKNVTVSGVFEVNIYTITYKVDDELYRVDTVAYGDTIVAAKAPKKSGLTFSGWSKMPVTMPARDLIVAGTFSGESYVVTYKVDGKVYQRDTLIYGSTILAAEEPEKEGYTFSGWNNLPETMPSKNITVKGEFLVNSYYINYWVDKEIYKVDTVAYGDAIEVIANPKKEGYTFSGWSEIPATMPAEDLTVTGTFSGKPYVLTYKVDGKVYQRDTLTSGATIIAPEPEKKGYTFSGWNKLPETMPAKNTTVEGTFSINSYILTYIVDEEVYHIDTLYYGDAISEIEAPEKTNYIFDGWIELPETMPAEDLTVMASFRPYSGVAEYNSDAIRVWTADKTIYIQTENTASYIIYNMLGHVMAQGVAEGEAQVAMPVQGVYQVVVNKRRHTVLVR